MLNLLCSAKYEEEEHTTMYPEYSKIAQDEGFDEIAKAFYNIANIEKHHSERYKTLAQRLKDEALFKRDEKVLWVCTHCGHVVEAKSAPVKCPVCEKKQGYFEILCDCL